MGIILRSSPAARPKANRKYENTSISASRPSRERVASCESEGVYFSYPLYLAFCLGLQHLTLYIRRHTHRERKRGKSVQENDLLLITTSGCHWEGKLCSIRVRSTMSGSAGLLCSCSMVIVVLLHAPTPRLIKSHLSLFWSVCMGYNVNVLQ